MKNIVKGDNSLGEAKCFEIKNGVLNCEYQDLVSIDFSECIELRELWCSHNNLKDLQVPEGLEKLWCHNNQLKEIELVDDLISVNCSNNQLNDLKVPRKLKILYCFSNKIMNLDVPENIEELYCNDNLLDRFQIGNKEITSKIKIDIEKYSDKDININIYY